MRDFGSAAVAVVALSCVSSAFAADPPPSSKNLGLQVRRAAGELERAEIVSVEAASLAAQAGLKQGDILLYAKGADGERNFLSGQDALERWAAAQAPSSAHELSYLRGKELLTANVVLPANAAAATANAAPDSEPASARLLGVTVKPGVDGNSVEITAVTAGSAAARAGLQVGDFLFSGQTGAVSADPLISQDALDAFATKSAGQTRDLIYARNKRFLAAKVSIPSGMPDSTQATVKDGALTRLVGITLKDIPDTGPQIIAVRPGSPADRAGLKAGDLFGGGDGLLSTVVRSAKDGDDYAAKYAGTRKTITYMRRGKVLNATFDIPTEAAAMAAAQSAPQPSALPAAAGLFGAATGLATATAVPSSGPALAQSVSGDPFAQTLTTLNGVDTAMPQFRLATGQVLEAVITANGAAITPRVCYIEDDTWNVDPEACYVTEVMQADGVVRYRHRAKEPELVTIAVESKDSAAGTYTIATRNGDRPGEGARALAVLEGLAGKAYLITNATQGLVLKAAVRYLPDEVGKRGRLQYQYENGASDTVSYALDNAGDLRWESTAKASGTAYLGLDGLVYNHNVSVGATGRGVGPNGEYVTVTDSWLAAADTNKTPNMGMFSRRGRQALVPPSSEEKLVAMMLEGPERVAKAQQQRAEDWGPFAQMAGNFYVFMINNNERIVSYQWEQPGESLVVKYWNSDALGTTPDPQQRMVYNPTRRSITNTVTYTDNSTSTTTLKREADGSMRETGYSAGTWFVSVKDGELTYRMEPAPGKNQLPTQTRRVLDANMLKVFAERTQARQARLAQERAQAAAQQQEEESGFGILDAFNFANTVQNAMSSPEGYLSAVTQAAPELAPLLNGMQAAQQGNNPLAGLGPMAGIGGGANPLTGLGGGGLGGGPTGVKGSYPTRPNLAEGSQCPGFTLGNYRTHAFNGGRDQQLFALCGQAFEYYKMYLNAIDQGYSEADANRTYNAHEGAVRNLRSM